jgi:hypothetical protein
MQIFLKWIVQVRRQLQFCAWIGRFKISKYFLNTNIKGPWINWAVWWFLKYAITISDANEFYECSLDDALLAIDFFVHRSADRSKKLINIRNCKTGKNIPEPREYIRKWHVYTGRFYIRSHRSIGFVNNSLIVREFAKLAKLYGSS